MLVCLRGNWQAMFWSWVHVRPDFSLCCCVAQQHRRDCKAEIITYVAVFSSKVSSSKHGPTCSKILLYSRFTSTRLVLQAQNKIHSDPRINTTLELFQHLSTTNCTTTTRYLEEHRHTQPLTLTSQALLISRAQGLTSTTISAKKTKVGLFPKLRISGKWPKFGPLVTESTTKFNSPSGRRFSVNCRNLSPNHNLFCCGNSPQQT